MYYGPLNNANMLYCCF